MPSPDPYNLQRFAAAQARVHDVVVRELAAGRKQTHWMWFVFPQARGLGRSDMAYRYGIASLDEARAYLADPVLGPRLRECARLVTDSATPSLRAIFGTPDDVKFVSSMTLFALAKGGEGGVFREALRRWNHGKLDAATVRLML